MKQRKQIRVYDLYRLAITGKASKIRGIHQYRCDETVTSACITLEDNPLPSHWYFRCRDEQDHKNLIRRVNKMVHFIEVGRYDIALAEYNDYNREYHRRWIDEA